MTQILDDFYRNKLNEYGSSAQGVGWKNNEAQVIRFKQLSKVFTLKNFTVNDLGCGVGDFLQFINEEGWDFKYRGYDLMTEMIDRATAKFENEKNGEFKLIKSSDEMQLADYTIASGIFNIRLEVDDEHWLASILETLRIMDQKSNIGFAFNILTKYSDSEFMRKELYYADPEYLFNFCKQNFSRNVALLHDYDQYDFTIIVRKKLL